jgi:SAM-dependent methyltransferase
VSEKANWLANLKAEAEVYLQTEPRMARAMGYNLGSGQRRFESNSQIEWVNIDIVSRPPDQVPDIVCDIKELPGKLGHGNADYVVAHHLVEHFGLGEFPFQTCFQLLKPGGSFLIFIPDIKALARRWLNGEISDYIYGVNLMGAFQGLETDRHRWHYTKCSLGQALKDSANWSTIKDFDWRAIPGGDFARDFWILAVEAVR